MEIKSSIDELFEFFSKLGQFLLPRALFALFLLLLLLRTFALSFFGIPGSLIECSFQWTDLLLKDEQLIVD